MINLSLIIYSVLFLYQVHSQNTECQSVALSALNPNQPQQAFIQSEPIILGNVQFCLSLQNKESCCSRDAFNDFQKNFDLFKSDMDRRNFEVVFQFNDMITKVLRNKFNILKTANQFNKYVDEQDEVIQFGLTQNETNGIINKEQVNQQDEQGEEIEIPAEFELYKDQILAIQQIIGIQENQRLIKLFDFSVFNYTNFFYYDSKDLGKFDIDKIKQEFDLIQIRMRNYVASAEQCFPILMKHFVGMECLICDNKLSDNFGSASEGPVFYFEADDSLCYDLMNSCFDYVKAMDEFNQNINMYLLSEISDSFQDGLSLNSLEYLIQVQEQISLNLKKMLFYNLPQDCKDRTDCIYICEKWPTSSSVNLQEIFQNLLQIQNYQAINEINFNISGIQDVNQNLQSSESTNAKRSSKELNIMIQKNDSTIHYIGNNQNNINPIEIGDESLNQNNFQFDGTSKIIVFNLTGKANEQDLKNYETNGIYQNFIQNQGKVFRILFTIIGISIMGL